MPGIRVCDTISLGDKQVSATQEQMAVRQRIKVQVMGSRYFVVKEQAVPEVLLKVVEAKKLLDTGRVHTVNEAADQVGISRSSFYKYKDDIFQFHDNSQGTTITLTFQMEDEPGLLSDVLKIVAEFGANILTIHQSIPIDGVASLSLSVQVLPTTGNVSEMLGTMERQKGVRNVKILAKK
ncbi:hypothetical protein IMSAGC019_00782 [Lachnospiraceae bacterium]|nr:hypothetical protein IMSAGC019_00782 [Lachnospiraceae bacterium]